MSSLVYSTLKLGAGTIYPAYESFKAVKTRNVKVGYASYGKYLQYVNIYQHDGICNILY